MYYDRKLDNGIRVVGQYIPAFPSVSVGIWVRTGSVNEGRGENGITHFIEHMLFKGTQKRSAQQIAAEMDDVGGILNAFTSKECTCYHAKVVGDDLEQAVELLSDLVFHSTLDPVELDKEKGVVLEEINMVEDSPEDLVHELLSAAYFQGHTLAQPILGTAQTVSSFAREDLLRYMDRRYDSDRIFIAAAGGFDFERLCDLCAKYTVDCRPGTGAGDDLSPFDFGTPGFVYKEKPIEQAHIAIAMPGYSMERDEIYAVSVFNNVFGGSMSSRLFQVIREELGLAYDVYAHPSSYYLCGAYNIYTGVNPKRAKDALAAILEQIDLARKKGIAREEFSRGKNQLRGNYILGLESTTSRMNAIGKSITLQGRVKTSEESLRGIEAVTYDDVHRVLDRILDRRAMAISAVGNINPQELESVIK